MKKVLVNDLAKVNSSNVNLVGFDGHSIYIQFKNGGIYSYTGTTASDYNNLKKADSIGKFLNTSIKPNFEFEKLEDVTLELDKPAEPQTSADQEVVALKKQVEDLYQALRIKQERIDELEEQLNVK